MTRCTTWIGPALLAATLASAHAQTTATPDTSRPVPANAAPLVKPAVAKPAVAKPVAPKPATPKPAPTATPKPAAAPALILPPAIPLNRNVIVLDAAHGGTDSGSRISDSLVEKDVTLGLAFKLRSLLTARGFTVIMTRDTEAAQSTEAAPTPVISLDDRAGTADHAHAVACLLLHATAAGHGVHLYSSELEPLSTQPAANPWLTAQAPWVMQSQRLLRSFGSALKRSDINIVMSRASVRPLDSLTCPALVIELAPSDDDAETVNDGAYQQKIATALAGALLNWKTDAQAPDPAPFATPTLGIKP